MDRLVKDMAETLGGGLHVEYTTGGGLFLFYRDKAEASAGIQDIMYADDLALAAETRSELQHMLNVLDNVCKRWGMNINGEKTKILIAGEQQEEAAPSPIMLQNHALQEVECFSYLGSQMETTGKVERE